MHKAASQMSPREHAIDLLARREYGREELRGRLLAKGHVLEDIDQALEVLADQGLQSDRRFAESFLRGRLMRGQGPVKMLAELGQRGIDRALAREALAELEREELWQKGELKAYYSRLVDILRIYLERQMSIQAMESTAEEIIGDLEDQNLPKDLFEYNTDRRKAIRQAARSVLPNATETKIFVTANVRALRHFIEMRGAIYADWEIRYLAIEIIIIIWGYKISYSC